MQPDLSRLLFFLAIVAVIQIVVDLIVIHSWGKFVKVKQWKKQYVVYPLYYLAIIMAIIGIYTGYERLIIGYNSSFGRMFQILIAIWYLPKIPIVLFIGISYMFTLATKTFHIIKRITGADQTQIQEDQSRRNFIKTAGWSSAVIPFIATGNGLLNTVYDFQVYKQELVIPQLPISMDGITIAQLSDIHAGSFFDHKPMQEVRRIISELSPDLLLITGDYVNFKPDELKIIYSELSRLNAPLGVYGSLGNHDHYNTPIEHKVLKKAIHDAGIHLLVNESVQIEANGSRVNLVGTDNTGFNQHFADIELALKNCDNQSATILMAHDPTFWDMDILRKKPVDLMLAGHTHGGQVGVQVAGIEMSFAQFVYKRWAGLYKEGDQYLYVNRGIGTVGPPIRLGIRPEITFFTLRSSIA